MFHSLDLQENAAGCWHACLLFCMCCRPLTMNEQITCAHTTSQLYTYTYYAYIHTYIVARGGQTHSCRMCLQHMMPVHVRRECHLIQSTLAVLCVSVSSSAAGLLNMTLCVVTLCSLFHCHPSTSLTLNWSLFNSALRSMDSQGTTYYNHISDRCTSVIALYVYSAGVVNSDRNAITKVDARTQGTNGTCHSVKVELDNCSASLDGAYINKSTTASVDGVRLSAKQSHIRVSVPNYEASRSIALWVTCTTRRSESLLKVETGWSQLQLSDWRLHLCSFVFKHIIVFMGYIYRYNDELWNSTKMVIIIYISV